jgi:hypothetical protein
VECLPEEGARIARLQCHGIDLLTVAPTTFQPPCGHFGRYEQRPVYGYDDCFPSVAAGRYPDGETHVPDHGELTWLKWDVTPDAFSLDCRVKSQIAPMEFARRMIFQSDRLIWEFSLHNVGQAPLPWLHVMHPLMPLREINRLDLPDFSQVQETFHQKPLAMKTGQEIAEYLLGCAKGQTTEIVLNGIRSGRVGIGLASGLAIEVKFSKKLFPTLNIWWNNGGCPDEEGCRRVEAAIEPVNGSCSDLVSAHADHTAQLLPPGGKASWKIEWIISR